MTCTKPWPQIHLTCFGWISTLTVQLHQYSLAEWANSHSQNLMESPISTYTVDVVGQISIYFWPCSALHFMKCFVFTLFFQIQEDNICYILTQEQYKDDDDKLKFIIIKECGVFSWNVFLVSVHYLEHWQIRHARSETRPRHNWNWLIAVTYSWSEKLMTAMPPWSHLMSLRSSKLLLYMIYKLKIILI